MADLGESLKIVISSEKFSLGCSTEITKEVQHAVVLQEVRGRVGEDLNLAFYRDLVGIRKIAVLAARALTSPRKDSIGKFIQMPCGSVSISCWNSSNTTGSIDKTN